MERPEQSQTAALSRAGAYDILRQKIIEFELLPGKFLSENGLASMLGVSRSPVWEALSRLAEENCVEAFPQRGTQVSRVSIERIRQTVSLRGVPEQSVLKTVCASGTPRRWGC